jgi:hypothetical protein
MSKPNNLHDLLAFCAELLPSAAGLKGALPERILLSRSEFEELQRALDEAKQAVLQIAAVKEFPVSAGAVIPGAAIPGVKRPPPLPRIRHIQIVRLSREQRLLQEEICSGSSDPAAYRIACRLLREGKDADATALKLSLPLREVRRIQDVLLQPERRRRDDEMKHEQVQTLLNELVVEEAENAAAGSCVSYSEVDANELSIERAQLLL